MTKKIIVYDEKELNYFTGYVETMNFKPDVTDSHYLDGTNTTTVTGMTITITTGEMNPSLNIELDPTTMLRIAEYNKQAEIEKYNGEIEKKKKEYENILAKIDYIKDNYSKYIEFCDNFKTMVENDFKDDEDVEDYYY